MTRLVFMKLQCSRFLLFVWLFSGSLGKPQQQQQQHARSHSGALAGPLLNPWQLPSSDDEDNNHGKLHNPLEYAHNVSSQAKFSQYLRESQDFFIQGIHSDEQDSSTTNTFRFPSERALHFRRRAPPRSAATPVRFPSSVSVPRPLSKRKRRVDAKASSKDVKKALSDFQALFVRAKGADPIRRQRRPISMIKVEKHISIDEQEKPISPLNSYSQTSYSDKEEQQQQLEMPTERTVNNHRVAIHPTSAYLIPAAGSGSVESSEGDLFVLSLKDKEPQVVTENPLRYAFRSITESTLDHMRLEQEDTLNIYRLREPVNETTTASEESEPHQDSLQAGSKYEKGPVPRQWPSLSPLQHTKRPPSTLQTDLKVSNHKKLEKVEVAKEAFPAEEIIEKFLLGAESATKAPMRMQLEEGLQSLLVHSGSQNYVQTHGGSESYRVGDSSELENEVDKPVNLSEDSSRDKTSFNLKKVRTVFDHYQDLESTLATKTLPRLQPHVAAEQLDQQPRMNAVASGQSLTPTQLYIFHATLVELHHIIREGRSRPGVPSELREALTEAEEHNMALLKYFFKLLLKADRSREGIVLSQPERREFMTHFTFLRQIFPFL